MATFQYTPLDTVRQEIRLLTLHPGTHDDPLIGTISHAPFHPPADRKSTRLKLKDLEKTLPPGWSVGETWEGRYIFWVTKTEQTFWNHPDPIFENALYEGYSDDLPPDLQPRFEALSYVWGSWDDPDALELRQDGAITGVSVSITRNLGVALRHLRSLSASRVLWVDAVCIDQNNILERNAQVPRMNMIYKLASRVVLWVGPSADDSSLALSRLCSLGQAVEYTKSDFMLPSPGALELDEKGWQSWPTYPYALEQLALSDNELAALSALFQRPWFSRLWIIQEAMLGNRFSIFQCGHDDLLWTRFRLAAETLRWIERLPLTMKASLMRVLHAIQDPSTTLPTAMFRIATTRQCHDPRDKIYGVLSVTPAGFRNLIRVDYSASKADVYRQAFVALLDHSQRLDVLAYGGRGHGNWAASWVPDWSHDVPHNPIDMARASGNSGAHVRFENPNVMITKGIRVSKVHRIQHYDRGDPTAAAAAIWRLWQHFASTTNREMMRDSIISCLTFDLSAELYPDTPYPTANEWRNEFTSTLLGDTVTEATARLPELFMRHIDSTIIFLDLSVAVLESGQFALVKPSALEGDLVVVFLGCGSPIALRQVTSSPDATFHVVGSACVAGTLDAAILLGPLPPMFSVTYALDESGFWRSSFTHKITGESVCDPRLGAVPEGWEELPRDRTPEDPLHFVRFRNRFNGEVVNWDPRLTPEALEARGVKVEEFALV